MCWVTVLELSGVHGLPSTPRGIRKLAKKSGWVFRKRAGSKAFEYHIDCLPEQAREIVKRRFLNQAVASAENCQTSVHV
ncbi:transposase, partial [Salmonella enterica]|nr:transposase [Salmonella enterica]